MRVTGKRQSEMDTWLHVGSGRASPDASCGVLPEEPSSADTEPEARLLFAKRLRLSGERALAAPAGYEVPAPAAVPLPHHANVPEGGCGRAAGGGGDGARLESPSPPAAVGAELGEYERVNALLHAMHEERTRRQGRRRGHEGVQR